MDEDGADGSAVSHFSAAVPEKSAKPIRMRMDIAYDGLRFRGLAPNPGVRTVVGELRRVLAPFVGTSELEIVMSGRTDAGVHASGQVLSFDVSTDFDPERVQRSINSRLGPEVVVRSLAPAAPGFNARFDATGRTYRYRVLNTDLPDPFSAHQAWWVSGRLDLLAMNAASEHFVGEHDFSSFCRRPKVKPGDRPKSLIRRVRSAQWTDAGSGFVHFEVSGTAFCHQMVRSIVGFLVSVGLGKRRGSEVVTVLASRDRSRAEPLAPPHGLMLVGVEYGQSPRK